MRLLYVIPGLGRGGGAERSLASMAPGLAAHGIELHVAMFSDRTALIPDIEAAGGTVTRLAGGSRRRLTGQLVSLIRSESPDLVHTTLFEADLAGRVAAAVTRTPVVSSLVNVAYGREHVDASVRRHRLIAAQGADAMTARIPVRFHAISRHVAEVMSPRLHIPPALIDVVPRGRSPEEMGTRGSARRAAARAALGVGPDVFLVVAAARHERQKGLDVMLEAFAEVASRLPHARLVVGGRDGSATPALHAAVRDLGLGDRVTFIGPRNDVPELLTAADTFVVPSRWEGLGSILIEAMALEAPTVASAIPPVADINSGAPWAHLVTPGQPHAFADAIVAIAADPDGAAARAAQGRLRFLAEYTTDHIANRMAGFYEQALLGRRSARRRGNTMS